MTVIRWALGLLWSLCIALTITRLTVDGVTVLAVVFFAAWLWSVGAFRPEVWVGAPEQDAEYARIDAEIRAHEEWREERARRLSS